MVAAISSSTVTSWSDSLFNKLDTKKQGYIDQDDLVSALSSSEPDSTTTSEDAAAMIKQIDGDGDGKITKSELSTAISKVADQLNAQYDASRVDTTAAEAATAATAATAAAATTAATTSDDTASTDTETTLNVSLSATSSATSSKGAAPAGGGGGTSATSSSDENKYVQAADTDADGTVSDAEAAAYKKLMAAQAEHAESAKHEGKTAGASSTDDTGSADNDKELARTLEMLKQYTATASNNTASTASSISETA